MDKSRVARELLMVAKALLSKEFANQDALDDYLHEHPDADPKNHSVKKKEHTPKDRNPFEKRTPAEKREDTNYHHPETKDYADQDIEDAHALDHAAWDHGYRGTKVDEVKRDPKLKELFTKFKQNGKLDHAKKIYQRARRRGDSEFKSVEKRQD